jgi:hypothetical protein
MAASTDNQKIFDIIFAKLPGEGITQQQQADHVANKYNRLRTFLNEKHSGSFIDPMAGQKLKVGKNNIESVKQSIDRLSEDVAKKALEHVASFVDEIAVSPGQLDDDDRDDNDREGRDRLPTEKLHWNDLLSASKKLQGQRQGQTGLSAGTVSLGTVPKKTTPAVLGNGGDGLDEIAAASKDIVRRNMVVALASADAAMTRLEVAAMREKHDALLQLNSVLADLDKIKLVDGIDTELGGGGRGWLSYRPLLGLTYSDE